MKAVGYRTAGAIERPDSLVDLTLPDPRPNPRDLVVRVKAVSVNPVDTKVRASSEPADGQTRVLGYDAAGTVEAVGTDVTLFKPGDEVFYAGDLNRPGTNAELHLVDERLVGQKPGSLDFAEAAALPLTSITAWEGLFDRLDIGRAVPGSTTILVIGSGGVGSMAIQLLGALTDLTIVATGALPADQARISALGAHHILDYRSPLAAAYAELGIEAPGFVFSTTHTEANLPEIVALIAPQGRIALIDDPRTLDIVSLKSKVLSVHWEYMFGRSLHATADMAQQHRLLNEIAGLIDSGKIRTTLAERLSPISASTLQLAHRRVEGGRVGGKVVVEGWP